jgi:hypothetical protein
MTRYGAHSNSTRIFATDVSFADGSTWWVISRAYDRQDAYRFVSRLHEGDGKVGRIADESRMRPEEALFVDTLLRNEAAATGRTYHILAHYPGEGRMEQQIGC